MGVVNSYERPFMREKQTKNNGKPLGKFIISKLFYFEKKKGYQDPLNLKCK